VLGLRPHHPEQTLEPDQRHMLETFATQLAIALERTAFAAQAEMARCTAETEQVRSALLSTVSHDLRTPLAAIAGAASTLREDAGALDPNTRRDLLQSISDESGRMNHLIGKLLEMTRLQAPGFLLARDWFPFEELVGAALTRMETILHAHVVETDLPPDLPLVHVDGVLVEELLVNLLENAARYSPGGSTIRITARNLSDGVRVEALDDGPGLKTGTEEAIFEKFFRDRPRTERTGTGLGLAICRAIIQLHGGRIGAKNRPEGGACFWFTLPPSSAEPPSLTALDAASAGAGAEPAPPTASTAEPSAASTAEPGPSAASPQAKAK
jgi:two-component system, OmpR family, sensor histidine kinase KdpD